ncbi:MAG: SigE family RNA polymerase sigma factor [Mycobacterium sp.]|nr:SigE family RNA polymerase sigma factor [Mycobacterium sp.]
MAEPAGFREYVLARQAALLRAAWLLTGDWHRAEDLVQTALAKVWPRWSRLSAEGQPDAYVRRVLVASYLTWRRRHWWAERPTATLPDLAVAEHGFAAADLRAVIGQLLPTLSPGQRAVLVLRFYEDLSVQETAEVLGCSAGTVKSQTAKALAKLRAVPVKGGAQ